MTMINCPECGNPISDKATICLRCGFPQLSNSKEERIRVHFTGECIPEGFEGQADLKIDGVAVGCASRQTDYHVLLAPGKHNICFSPVHIYGYGCQVDIPDDIRCLYIALGIKEGTKQEFELKYIRPEE